MRRRLEVLAATAMAVALAVSSACRTETSAPESARPPAADSPPASTPPASEGVAWIASSRQVGPVRIGMTAADAETAIGAPFAPADPGPCIYRRSSALPMGVMLMDVAGRIVRVDITTPGVSTAEGIGVGDSAARVHDTYGVGVIVSPHKYTTGQYLTLASDAEHRLVFETDGERVTRYRVGRLPEVEWVEGCS